MKNIMKSIWYEIYHSKLMIRIYIVFIFVMGLIGFLNSETERGTYSAGASGMLADIHEVTYEFPIFILALIVGIICGEDYKDKVANYEVLSGHSRKSIFFARTLMGIIIGSVFATLLCFVTILTAWLKTGWGDSLVFGDVMIRTCLMIFPMLRLAAFFAVLTFLIKNPYIIMAIGFITCMSPALLNNMLAHSKSIFVSIFNMALLCDYKGWSIYNIDPSEGIVYYNSYESSVSSGLVIGTIVASLVMTVFYLFMGYALFRRDELN